LLAFADRALKGWTVSETGGVVSHQRLKSILRTDELSQSDRVAARYICRSEKRHRLEGTSAQRNEQSNGFSSE